MIVTQRRTLPRTTYVSASPETWSLIRGAYLSGLSAPTVAARFGVSVTAIRKRAQREGWTKRDLAARASPWRTCRLNDAAPDAAPDDSSSTPADPTDPNASITEDQVMAWWRHPSRIRPVDLARKALSCAAQAVRAGEGLEALRLARAAAEITRLDAILEYEIDDVAVTEAAHEGQTRMMLVYIHQQALRLAQDLAAGRPLPPQYVAAQKLNEADDAFTAAETAAKAGAA